MSDGFGDDDPQVPRIECGKCGHEHHIDCTTGEFQGRCSECFGFLRRPTDEEREQFYDFMEWRAEITEASMPSEDGAEYTDGIALDDLRCLAWVGGEECSNDVHGVKDGVPLCEHHLDKSGFYQYPRVPVEEEPPGYGELLAGQ